MLPPKPYRSSHKKFGLIPEEKGVTQKDVPVTIQTFTLYSLLAPLMDKQQTLMEPATNQQPEQENKNQA